MSQSPGGDPSPAKTVLNQVTQLFQQVRSRLNLTRLELRKGARVPTLVVDDPERQTQKNYRLVGDRYCLGRSQTADIVIQNAMVSGQHLSLRRNPKSGRTVFLLKDEGSTNGVYWRQRRLKTLILEHGDRLTLGPAALAKAPTLRYLNPPAWYQRFWRWGLYGTAGAAMLGCLLIAVEWGQVPVRILGQVQGPILAYAEDGEPLQTGQNASHVELKALRDFSPYLPKAVVASEDSRFYWHFGFDPIRILSAIIINVRSGQIEEGASTLTQQIARSLFPNYVGREDTLGRKLREVLVALKLETFYSKDYLLLTYLNRVYLGVGYGFEDGAQYYFRKSAQDLDLSEAATLVAMLPAPNTFNPCDDPETSRGLRNRVINRMATLGSVSEAEAQAALRTPIVVDPRVCQQQSRILSPYFYGQIIQELQNLFGPEETQAGNFVVETGLNLEVQTLAEESLRDFVQKRGSQYQFSQGAIVTLDARNGDILALVGGIDYETSQFNRATQALRQPGSTFKIFAYTAALEDGISANTTYSCAPLTWQGQSYSGCERSSGNIDFEQAIAQSENAVALRVAQQVGLDQVVQTARQMGISTPLQAVPGLVLGQSEVTLLDLTGAFATLANGGIHYRPHAVNEVYDSNQCQNPQDFRSCRLSYDFNQDISGADRAVPTAVANTMTSLLEAVVQDGTGRLAAIGQTVAGKTGTTNDGVDLVFVGYLPRQQIVTGIWLGNDDNSPTTGGSWLAAELWSDYMRKALANF
ncbi:MAG: transglycosylase domain-containing protein [Cyanobacteria bacterium P01_H01_bin.121]